MSPTWPRVCAAKRRAGQVLVDRKIMARLNGMVAATELGPLSLKGFTHAVPAFALLVNGDLS